MFQSDIIIISVIKLKIQQISIHNSFSKPIMSSVSSNKKLIKQSKIVELLPYASLKQFKNHESIQQIKAVYLCRYNMTEKPDLSQIPNLQVLWLNFNQIAVVGKSFKSRANCKQIYLNHNCISQLQGFQCCDKIQKLNLSYNLINEIPKYLQMPKNLKILLLSQNKIVSVQLLCRCQLLNLQSLYLSGNYLSSAKTLRRLNCSNMKRLYLDGNLISQFANYDQFYLKPGSFVNLVNLQYTLDQVNTTTLKIGSILSPRARCKSQDIIFK